MVWDSQPEISAKQTFPPQMSRVLLNKFNDSTLFEAEHQSPASRGSPKRYSRFDRLDTCTGFSVDSYAVGVIITKSSVLHPSARLDVFAARPYGRGAIIGH